MMGGFHSRVGACINRSPGWLKLVVALALYLALTFDLVPMALRWPVRIVIPLIAVWGYVQSLFVICGRSPLQVAGAIVRHPTFWVIALTALSLVIKEAYPFSNYPMYADPRATKDFFFLGKVGESGDTEPLPMRPLTRVSSAKSGKIYRARRDRYCRKQGKKPTDLTAAEITDISLEVLDFLHQRAIDIQGEGTGREVWRFVRVEVTATEDGLTETPFILAERDYSN